MNLTISFSNIIYSPTIMKLSPIRYILPNDDKMTFSAILPRRFFIFKYSPLSMLFSHEFTEISLGSCASCNGYQYIAFSGLPADTQFDTQQASVYDLQNLNDIKQIFRQKFNDHILSMSLTPQLFICSFYKHVEIWDISSNSKIQEIPTAINVHAPCSVSASFSLLVTCGASPQDVTLIELGQSKARQIKVADNSVSLVSFSPSGQYLAVSSSSGHAIKIFDVQTGKCLVMCKRGNTASVIHSIAFSPNCHFIAIISQNGTVHFFDLREKLHTDGSSFPTIRACQKVKVVDQSTITRLCWFLPSKLAIVSFEGNTIILTIDENTCEEVGRSQTMFLRKILEEAIN